MDDPSRIEALEFKCAYLERSAQELSDVLARQQQELDRARARIEDLARQLEALDMVAGGTGGPPDPRSEIPPHY
ncbi:MAG: SlyX family protein [Gammaproteobacteria bacterium]|nr:SlyX family protein [Gammaproteobacteria bacterium]